MPSLIESAALLFFLSWFASAGQSRSDPMVEMRNAPFWQERRAALHLVLKQASISEPLVQASIVRLFDQETADPNWASLSEGQEYEEYYDELLSLCKQAAERYHNAAAWHALVYSSYNVSSTLGQWLIAQPETLPLCMEMLRSAKDGRDGLAIQALASMLARCNAPGTPNCSTVLAKGGELMNIMQQALRSPPPLALKGLTGSDGLAHVDQRRQAQELLLIGAIQALAICGGPADLPALQNLANHYGQEMIDGTDTLGLQNKGAALSLIHRAERMIKARDAAKATGR